MQLPPESCYTCSCCSPELEKTPVRTTWREKRGERGVGRERRKRGSTGQEERVRGNKREKEVQASCSCSSPSSLLTLNCMRPWARPAQTIFSQILTHRNCETQWNDSCFKLLNLGGICYLGMDIWNIVPVFAGGCLMQHQGYYETHINLILNTQNTLQGIQSLKSDENAIHVW